jgi:predicted RNA-binding protein YlxR (DUF448 family)
MTAVLKRADGKVDAPRSDTKVSDTGRRCLASGEMKSRTEMIRFVIAPDQSVVPDLSENLPGHGLWVTANAASINLAAQKNLFAKAAKEPARVAPELVDTVIRLLHKRCLEFFGLGKGAGIAVLGETQTETALRANKLALYLYAPDATRTLDNRNNIAECQLFTRDEMGSAFGYDQIVYAGLMPHKLTEKLKREINRLRSMLSVKENEG